MRTRYHGVQLFREPRLEIVSEITMAAEVADRTAMEKNTYFFETAEVAVFYEIAE